MSNDNGARNKSGQIGGTEGNPQRTNAAGVTITPDEQELLEAARKVREQSYSPYSNYAVGAAVLTQNGRIFMGTNVENASYPLSICAERAAIFKAISEGERNFTSIAVVTENGGTPCGACRQMMAEFAPNLRVIVADANAVTSVFTLEELLPHAFNFTKLGAYEAQ